ncbi:MAG: hypothetical protein HRT44_06320 [Bdellovibrionales bacterium]|nr:hypothetical protein [Bdellovibrionales bacterium]NQZ18857.1 hypothetical protein [Bdellovibrionales bacterium]
MYKNLRLAILDYPKFLVKDETSMRMFSEVIQSKQINFQRANPYYVPMSALDMISTHYLVYETSDIYKPQLIMAIRTCFEDRAKKHRIDMPYTGYEKAFSVDQKERFYSFKNSKNFLVDTNALFVDRKFSFNRTGLPLMDIGYLMLVTHIMRRGGDHFMGIGNYRYKTHKWVEPVGDFDQDMIFNHPVVNADHMLIMLKNFNLKWLSEAHEKYKDLYSNRIEILPQDSGEEFISLEEIISTLPKDLNQAERTLREVDFVSGKPIAS